MKEKIKNIYLKNEEIIKYIIIGGCTTVVSFAIYYGLVFTILDPNKKLELQIANVASWIGAVTFAYITNRIIVFKSKNKNIFTEALSFFGSRVTTLLIDMLLMFLLVSVLKYNDKICKILVQFIILVSNYIISKFIVFKKRNNGEGEQSN